MKKRLCVVDVLKNEIECLRRENDMLLNAEKYDNKSELKAEYERGKRDAEREFKNRYGIPGNKSVIEHMLNQRRNIDILQKKYEKLLKQDQFISGINCNVKINVVDNLNQSKPEIKW